MDRDGSMFHFRCSMFHVPNGQSAKGSRQKAVGNFYIKILLAWCENNGAPQADSQNWNMEHAKCKMEHEYLNYPLSETNSR